MINEPGYITSVLTDIKKHNPIEVGGNLRLDMHQQLGIRYFQLNNNPRIDNCKDLLLYALQQDNLNFSPTLVISKDILDDKELLDAIRAKAEKSNILLFIRIADEGYTLTKDDYDKLSFAAHIFVDDCVEELNDNDNIIIQNEVFKFDIQYAQPVLERRNQFDDMETRQTFHINHKLSEDEFMFLAQYLNNFTSAAIELDYFDPKYYEEFLEGLQRHNVKDNINIQLIGYLLEDDLDTFSSLEKYPYEIDIVYSTCHDMVDKYQQEPYTANRLYYSQIEGGGKTSLRNYLNVLEEVDIFERSVQRGNLSPLEAAILAKIQIDTEYIYDPDADFVDEWDNINLSQMINHEVDCRKRAVCMGFSTLYSALLRRTGIPMFRYSTTGHSRNIGRIKDDKYGVDNICVSDITFDLQSDNSDLPTYSHFMLAPREFTKNPRSTGEYEHMTIADTLALPIDEYYNLVVPTNLHYEEFYHPYGYDPMGYTARMLELMGEGPKEGLGIDVYDVIYNLCEKGNLESIPQETILSAIDRVIEYLGLSDENKNFYHELANNSFTNRSNIFNGTPAIEGNNIGERYNVNLLTPDNIKDYRSTLPEERPKYYMTFPDEVTDNNTNNTQQDTNEIDEMIDDNIEYIPGTNIPKPRDRGVYETDEEYVEFLKNYYEQYFPNTSYLQRLTDYVREQNITIYDYYVNVADCYRNNERDRLQSFERDNPFIKEEDINLLIESNDNRMPLFFASSLSKLVENNLSQDELQQMNDLFVDTVERYNEEVGYRL